jgi:hypothetical protein
MKRIFGQLFFISYERAKNIKQIKKRHAMGIYPTAYHGRRVLLKDICHEPFYHRTGAFVLFPTPMYTVEVGV